MTSDTGRCAVTPISQTDPRKPEALGLGKACDHFKQGPTKA